MSTILYAYNLSHDVTQAQLLELFSRAGEVSDVYLITDRWTATPKGFGFIEMATAAAAKNAILILNGTQWLNRTLQVRLTTESDERMGSIKSGQPIGSANNT